MYDLATRHDMLRTLQIAGVGPVDDLRIDLAQRLNLIAGDNGLGKSFLLDAVWWALTHTWASVPMEPRQVPARISATWQGASSAGKPTRFETEYSADNLRWSWRFERSDEVETRLTMPGLIVHARVDGGFAVHDSMRTSLAFWKKGESGSIFKLDPQEVWDGKVVDGSPRCNGLIRDWVDWQREGTDGSLAFQRLRRVLTRLSPEAGEELRPGPPARLPDDSRAIPTLRMPYGVVPITHASAGMRRIAALAYVLVWAFEENAVAAARTRQRPERRLLFLIDEIEAHLHPRWQRVVMPALLNVGVEIDTPELEPTQVQFLVTTHSPLVLASLEPHFDIARDALWTLDLVGNSVRATKTLWERHGNASNWLTSDVFDLKSSRSKEAEAVITRIDAIDPSAPPRARELDAIEREMARVLGELDPLWPRWRELRESLHRAPPPAKPRKRASASKRTSR